MGVLIITINFSSIFDAPIAQLDRAPASGAGSTGSSPVGGTNLHMITFIKMLNIAVLNESILVGLSIGL